MRIYNRCVHKYLNELTREYRAHIFDRIQYATVPITSELVQCGQRPIPHYVLMMKHPADHAAEQRKGIVFFLEALIDHFVTNFPLVMSEK